jgi:iron complex outermembrane receptor protein
MKQQFSNTQCTSALFAALLSSVIPFQYVAAQTPNSGPTLIVSGSRFEENLNEVPANVKVITRDEIANSSSNNIPEVLSQIGGLNVRGSNLGQLSLDATVDMGGYGVTANSNTLILIDGQRLNPIDSLGVNWQSIPIDSIERIEIVQGGASVQYGNGAVGGVINIITNGGKANLNQASVSYGSFNTLINNAILRNTVDKTTIQLTANTSNTGGWRQNSAANAYSFDGKITQDLGGINKVYADAYYSYTNAQSPGGVLGQVGQGNTQAAKFNNIGSQNTNTTSGIRGGAIYGINPNWTFEADASYGNRSLAYNAPYYNSADSLIFGIYPGGPTSTNAQSWDMTFTPRAKGNFGKWGTTVVGYDFNQASQNGSNAYGTLSQQAILALQDQPYGYYGGLLNNSQSAKIINQSLYIVSRIPITSSIDASGGFRRQVQNASTTDTNIASPNGTVNASQNYGANAGDIALNYNYLKGQKIYAKWNQSFRFPNIDEFWGFDPNTNNRIFSGILQPQTSQTYQIGGEWSLNKFKVSTSLFQSLTMNEIRYNPATYYNTNDPNNISRKGVILDSTSTLFSKLTLSAGGTYQNTAYTTGPYSGSGIGLAPNLLLNARANYWLNNQWSLGGVVNYVSEQRYDASPTVSNSLSMMPAYTVADVFASYRTGKWETRLTIKNVGNASYSTYGGYGFVSLPGGTGRSSYYYFPSDPRAYYLTAKYSF